MKKVMIMITAAVLLLSTGSFAAKVKEYVTEKALTAFAKDFSGATNVNWQEKGNFYLVEFRVGETSFTAAYSKEGELLVSEKRMKLKELSPAVIYMIKEKYPAYEIGENVTELAFEGKSNYTFTISNSNEVLYIKLNSAGQVNIENRIEL